MKKIMAILILTGLATTVLADTNTSFTTPDMAAQHCPATNGLIFTADPRMPNNNFGRIDGEKSGIYFTNAQPIYFPPRSLTNPIQGVNFRKSGDNTYGNITDNIISCFYSYPGFTGQSIPLTMAGPN